MDNNPSPGNKEGGLTTILEKSLGAAAKGGTTTLVGVYRYAEPMDARGLRLHGQPRLRSRLRDRPDRSGCNVVGFTTGRGSVSGFKPSPSIKIATNSAMYGRMTEDMDINAGRIISDGRRSRRSGREIFELILRVASGEHVEVGGPGLRRQRVRALADRRDDVRRAARASRPQGGYRPVPEPWRRHMVGWAKGRIGPKLNRYGDDHGFPALQPGLQGRGQDPAAPPQEWRQSLAAARMDRPSGRNPELSPDHGGRDHCR